LVVVILELWSAYHRISRANFAVEPDENICLIRTKEEHIMTLMTMDIKVLATQDRRSNWAVNA